jgi:hypothetical protein
MGGLRWDHDWALLGSARQIWRGECSGIGIYDLVLESASRTDGLLDRGKQNETYHAVVLAIFFNGV